jgi:hypothetical protein
LAVRGTEAYLAATLEGLKQFLQQLDLPGLAGGASVAQRAAIDRQFKQAGPNGPGSRWQGRS